MQMNSHNLPHSGRILDSKRVAGFCLTEIAYAPKARVPRHSHQHACFSLALQGRYTELYQRKTIEGGPSVLVFRPAGEMHANHFDDLNVRCFLIEAEAEWLARLRKYSAAMDQPMSFKSGSIVRMALSLRYELAQPDCSTPLAVEGLMLELVAGISRKSVKISEHKHPYWLKQVREILHDRFNERITLSEIAGAVGVHPMYLAATFKKRYRHSVGEYIRQLRIDFACDQIANTNAPLTEIALAAGFSHQSHFSRTFRRHTGFTPGRYRSALRSS